MIVEVIVDVLVPLHCAVVQEAHERVACFVCGSSLNFRSKKTILHSAIKITLACVHWHTGRQEECKPRVRRMWRSFSTPYSCTPRMALSAGISRLVRPTPSTNGGKEGRSRW